jgi:hypothetical protein
VGMQSDSLLDTSNTQLKLTNTANTFAIESSDIDPFVYNNPRGTINLSTIIDFQKSNLYNVREFTLVMQATDAAYDIQAVPSANGNTWQRYNYTTFKDLATTGATPLVSLLNQAVASSTSATPGKITSDVRLTIKLDSPTADATETYTILVRASDNKSAADLVNLINVYSEATGIYARYNSSAKNFTDIFTTSSTSDPNKISSFSVQIGSGATHSYTYDTVNSQMIVYQQQFPEGLGANWYADEMLFSYNLTKLMGDSIKTIGFNSLDLISLSRGQNEDLTTIANPSSSATSASIMDAISPQNILSITGADYFSASAAQISYSAKSAASYQSAAASSPSSIATTSQNAFINVGSDGLTTNSSASSSILTSSFASTTSKYWNHNAFIDYWTTSGTNNIATYRSAGGADLFYTKASGNVSGTSTPEINVLEYYKQGSSFGVSTTNSYSSKMAVTYVGSDTNFDFLVGSSGSDNLYSARGDSASGSSINKLYSIALQTDYAAVSTSVSAADTSNIQNFMVRDALIGGSGNDNYYTGNKLITLTESAVDYGANDYNIIGGSLVVTGSGNNNIYSGLGGDIMILSGSVGLQGEKITTAGTASTTDITAGEVIWTSITNDPAIAPDTSSTYAFRLQSVGTSGLVDQIYSANNSDNVGQSVALLSNNQGADVIHYSLASVVADNEANRDIIYLFGAQDKIDLKLLFDQLGVDEASRKVFSTTDTTSDPGVIKLDDISLDPSFQPLAGSNETTGTRVSVQYQGHDYMIADIYGMKPSDFITVSGDGTTDSNYFIT